MSMLRRHCMANMSWGDSCPDSLFGMRVFCDVQRINGVNYIVPRSSGMGRLRVGPWSRYSCLDIR